MAVNCSIAGVRLSATNEYSAFVHNNRTSSKDKLIAIRSKKDKTR
jgi:hypothetical protein